MSQYDIGLWGELVCDGQKYAGPVEMPAISSPLSWTVDSELRKLCSVAAVCMPPEERLQLISSIFA